jgi:hypothetical protein
LLLYGPRIILLNKGNFVAAGFLMRDFTEHQMVTVT